MACDGAAGAPGSRSADWDDVAVFPASGHAHIGSVVWGLAPEAAAGVVEALARNSSPLGVSSDAWAVAAHLPDGSVVATCSPAYGAGLCWTADDSDEPRLIIGPYVGGVVSHRRTARGLDDRFAAARFGVQAAPANATPFTDVWHVPPGVTARWSRATATPTLQQWCGPDVWPDPGLGGAHLAGAYRAAFDDAVDALLPADGPLCSTMSGGLDSTFVVASLMRHASASRPVHAFVHSPHPRARPRPRDNWDPDDYPVAMAMGQRYSNLVIHRVFDNEPRAPLEVAATLARRRWAPPSNTLNLPWIHSIEKAAADLGADRLFFGGGGNFAFSHSHSYAAGYHAARGDWADVAAIARPYPGTTGRQMRTGTALLASQLSGAAKRRLAAAVPAPHPWIAYVPDAAPQLWTTRGTPRERYLLMLSGSSRRHLALSFAGWQTKPVDPFATEAVLSLAAAIKPSAWARAGTPRGFARWVAEGRLPDEIRLRTRRGGQARDAWYAIHDKPAQHHEAAQALVDDPTLGRWIDADALLRDVRGWPWGQAQAQAPQGFAAVMDLLAYGVAWRTLRSMLSA